MKKHTFVIISLFLFLTILPILSLAENQTNYTHNYTQNSTYNSSQNNQTNSTQNNPQNKDLKLEVYLSNPQQNLEYSNLFKITNLNHISGQTDQINITVQYNLTKNNSLQIQNQFNITINSYKFTNTGTIIFPSSGNYTLCGTIINSSHPDNNTQNNKDCKNFIIQDILNSTCNISINISTEKTIYNNNEQIKFFNNINNNTLPFAIEYWIEDLFGNIIKSKTNTSNTNQKSYTPNIQESEKTLIIKNKLIISACNNSGIQQSEKLITVKNNLTHQSNSYFEITSTPTSASFGETISVTINAYKGNTSKRTIYLWVEGPNNKKATIEKSKINLNEKYSEHSFTITLQLKPNCDEKLNSGDYLINIEGLDTITQKTISLQGKNSDLCKIEYLEIPQQNENYPQEEITGTHYTIKQFPQQITNNLPFNITINITNNNPSPHDFSIWAYIYSGPVCYSGEREQNKNIITLQPTSHQLINLSITPSVTDFDKEYKLKVKIKKDSQITNTELTENINITQQQTNVTNNNQQNQQNTTSNSTNFSQNINLNQNKYQQPTLPTGMIIQNTTNNQTIFQSSTTKVKNYLIYPIILLSSTAIFFLFKKNFLNT